MPWEQIAAELEAELGRPLEEVFATIDPEPVAAASIGQAHAATRPDGREVVVKVRRPGIVERVGEDLEILANLAARAARRWPEAQDYDVEGLARQFAGTLRAELDYLAAAANATGGAGSSTSAWSAPSATPPARALPGRWSPSPPATTTA